MDSFGVFLFFFLSLLWQTNSLIWNSLKVEEKDLKPWCLSLCSYSQFSSWGSHLMLFCFGTFQLWNKGSDTVVQESTVARNTQLCHHLQTQLFMSISLPFNLPFMSIQCPAKRHLNASLPPMKILSRPCVVCVFSCFFLLFRGVPGSPCISLWSLLGLAIDCSGFRCDRILIGFIKLSQAALYKHSHGSNHCSVYAALTKNIM